MFKKILLTLLVLPIGIINNASAQTSSEIVSFVSSPANAALSLRGDTAPPQPGVDLYVFGTVGFPFDAEAPYGNIYTLQFNVNGRPASVVAIPGEILDYQFSPGTSGNPSFPDVLTVEFEHVPYAGGILGDLPGPETDFSIAIIPVNDSIANGPPAEMSGSYMSTNLSPFSWTLVPPSTEDPQFGFELSGPSGETAFFDFFVPQVALDALAALYGEPITASDLALFNNGNQVSVDFDELPTGAKISVNVIFSSASDVVEDESILDQDALAANARLRNQASALKKKLTVNRAENVSLAPNKKSVKAGKKVRLFGWVRGGEAGKLVKINSKGIAASQLDKARKKKFITAKLDTEGRYQKAVILKATDTFRATYKPSTGSVQRSKKLKVRASK